MPTASLEFTLFMNTADIGRGMGRVRNEIATGLRGMAQAAKEESQRIQSALASITAFRELKQKIVETRAEWAKTQTEAAALGTAMLALGRPPEIAATAINALMLTLQTAPTREADFKQALARMGWPGASCGPGW